MNNPVLCRIISDLKSVPTILNDIDSKESDIFFSELRKIGVLVDPKIDFDLASECWRRDTGADNEKELKKRQRAWKRELTTLRRSKRKRTAIV